ncbi:Copper amine oxidase N-terminal domain-containing protein [Paenibacillus sp. 1_12]|uniref:stalk domain-containing protein n=1 Tax=Paenibacillus sp. 1_12 TaxID=1566278 RepID=UPI0008E5822C|nr:DUF4163 domain-containing protein [Paenibacillus sp. 1_12]SFK73859.1 Copper amine oxidase N-terminal domain-containing protein [Paenibacillus sp. 1_12]
MNSKYDKTMSITGSQSRSKRKSAKRGRKRLLALVIAVAVGGSANLPLEGPLEAYAALLGGDRIMVHSNPLLIDGVSKAVPTANVHGDTYIGLRSLSDELGLDIGYDADNQTVLISGRGRTLKFEIKQENGAYLLNDQLIYALPIIIEDDSTYVPLRFFLESVGYGISYDAALGMVGITTIKENPITFKTEQIAEANEGISLKVSYPQIAGFANADIQQKVNAFLKKEIENHVSADKTMLNKAAADNKQWEADNAKIKIPPVSLDGVYKVTYNEQNRLSLYIDYYMYLGGAHGMTERVPYTFDLTTGNLLTLQEAAAGNANYVSIINNEIMKQYKEDGLSLLAPFKTIEPERPYFLKHNGVVIYFNQYEYTAYASGMPEFEIPFASFR